MNQSGTESPNEFLQKNHPLRGYLYIATATFFWAVAAAMGRAVFTGRLLLHGRAFGSIDPLILSQARATFSFLVLAPVLLASRRWNGVKISRSDLGQLALLGVFGLAAANYLYYLAIQKTNVATAIMVQYTAPVWVLLYMVARGYQRPTIQKLTAVALSVIGIGIAIGAFSEIAAHLNYSGVAAALLAAFSCAFYNISGHNVMARHDHWLVMLYMTLAASIFWIAANPPWRIVSAHYSLSQWLFLAVFSLISMLIPFSLYFAGLRYLEPTRAIVTSCLEPVFAISLAAIFLKESVRPTQILGMIMVLAAIVVVQMPDSRRPA